MLLGEHLIQRRDSTWLQAVIDRHADTARQPDVWTPRQFAIPATARGTEVGLAVWDSGVDLSLFRMLPGRGIAFNEDAAPSTHLMRPLGDAESRWPQLQQLVKGAMDLRAARDTPDARQLRQAVGTMKADQTKAFQEDLPLAGLYTHGTHVAGIAEQGNPDARVQAATMLRRHRMEPPKPTEERSQAVRAEARAHGSAGTAGPPGFGRTHGPGSPESSAP